MKKQVKINKTRSRVKKTKTTTNSPFTLLIDIGRITLITLLVGIAIWVLFK